MLGALATLLFLASAPAPEPLHLASWRLTPADSLIRSGESHFAHLWKVTGQRHDPTQMCACPRWALNGKNLTFEDDGRTRMMSPAYVEEGQFIYSVSADTVNLLSTRWRDEKWPLHPDSRLIRSYIIGGHMLNLDPGTIECSASADGKQVVFTATFANDPELYVTDPYATSLRRLTADYGYDGGGCFSPDGQLICYQAYHPRLEDEKAMYADLLAKHLVDSSLLDIWIIHPDGSGRGQVTDLGGTSMEPSFTPDSKRIIFSSDYQDVPGRQFDLYITKLDGGTPERITNDPSPDCFPMFSPNGRYLAFTSGRGASTAGAQNVFIAEWK